ncbi:hypothetical protein [Christiangramia crocea]|uniref:Lipocalin-like domain-containing protein n=1 Tax=Christiangramia crocea TaxID=2904124 RepID=A0A9X1UVA4_9FLAO|nr:hypothetical protein [Gramella crocea]MCG9970955.1 hypothetical protein [Gramella crocea]
MKSRTLLILFSILLSFSCSRENEGLLTEDFSVNQYPQTWKLFRMTGNMENHETNGEDMVWQEEYIFRSNGTVTKLREQDGETSDITGNYSLFNENERQGILIEYIEDSSLIGSCTGPEETLYFDEEDRVLYSNWWACDGPGLFYKRK